MKNIVVGVDFSNNSLNVLKHAIAAAIRFEAAIHLVWVRTPSVMRHADVEGKDEYSELSKQKLANLLEEVRKEAEGCDVQSIVLEGKPPIELSKYANNLEDAVLAVGTHGMSGYEEKYVGSNVVRTVALSRIPVLTLREGINIGRDLTQVLVPIDTSFETLQKMRHAINFAKAFNAKVMILGVYTAATNEVKHVVDIQINFAKKMCDNANVRNDVDAIHTQDGMENAVIEYAKKIDANLLVVMREEEDEFSDLWLGNSTRRLLSSTPMPMLIVPNINHMNISK